jgi:hypothetical protein
VDRLHNTYFRFALRWHATNQCGQASAIISTSYLPKVFCKRGVDVGNTFSYTPYWGAYTAGDSVVNDNKNVGAQLVQIGPASGSANSGITGALNFSLGPLGGPVPCQIITTMDGSPQRTVATPGYVRTGSAKGSFIGTDSSGSPGSQDQTYGVPGRHNFCVNDVGTSGTTWKFQVGSATATFQILKANSYSFGGTTYTTNAGCSETSIIGGATGGSVLVGSTSCTTVITMGSSATATHAWSCWVMMKPHRAAIVTRTALRRPRPRPPSSAVRWYRATKSYGDV